MQVLTKKYFYEQESEKVWVSFKLLSWYVGRQVVAADNQRYDVLQ